MTFALSGNLITQSGTDNDATTIGGLSAIAGVTTIAESGRTRLIIPYRLLITGTMTNTSAVAFTFNRNASPPQNEVSVTGRWNYKEARTLNGLTDWRIMPPLIFTQPANNGYNGTNNNLIYLQNGTLDFAKLEIIGNGGQYWDGGTVIYRDVIINAEGLAAVNDCQITTQSGNPTLDIDGLEIRGASSFFKDYVTTRLNRLKPKFAARGFGSGFGLNKVLQDFDGTGTGFDLAIYGGGSIRCNNPVKGGGVRCGPWNSPNNVNNEYYCTSDLVLTGVNELAAPVVFKAYHRDNNTSAPISAGTSATNYTLRKTYNVASTAAGVATLNILLSAGLNDNAMVRRSVTQADDLYAFNCFSYLSQPTATSSINLAGAAVKAAIVVQLRDQNISQMDKAIVDAYASIDTLDQLYDRAKAYLFDNFAGDPALLASASGTVLDLGPRNLVIDGTAATAFALSATTITIKSAALAVGTKFKSLKTTGTVSAANGGSSSAPYVDAAQAGLIPVAGALPTDTVEMRRLSDGTVMATRAGSGNITIAPANIGLQAYFVRLVGMDIVMSTKMTPVTLVAGVNAELAMFAGPQVAVADAQEIKGLTAKLDIIHNAVKTCSLGIPVSGNLP